MKITNADVQGALGHLVHICCTGNRLDSIPSARAYRIKETLGKAWESADHVRLQLCKDHGQLNEDGTQYVFPTAPARDAFQKGWGDILKEERELEIETLTEAEIDAGWFRTPDGKREKFDLSPEARGFLKRVGILTEAP